MEIHVSTGKKQPNYLKSEEPMQESPYSHIWRFFISQDLSLINIKDFQTCSLEGLDEILKYKKISPALILMLLKYGF